MLAAAGWAAFDLDPCSPGVAGTDPERIFQAAVEAAEEKRGDTFRVYPFHIPAELAYTAGVDGLSMPWSIDYARYPSPFVWVNPPYSAVAKWMAKCAAEAAMGAVIAALVPARTCSRWWHAHVAGRADILLLRGRLRFELASGKPASSAPFPSALIVWNGGDMAARLAAVHDAQLIPRDRV